MDHETVVQINATERYFLGQLADADRDSFEEHYFTCPECAEDVRALTVFAANARAVFREKAAGPAPHAGMLLSGRALWLSAAFNVVLLLAAGYGLLKLGPEKNRELADARAPQFVQTVPVLGVSRGPGNDRRISSATRRIVFSFYLMQPFPRLGYELKDASGSIRSRQVLPAPLQEEAAESHLSLSTAGLQPGEYEIRIWGLTAGLETPIGQSRFKIESPISAAPAR
jgi:hypothetical protein